MTTGEVIAICAAIVSGFTFIVSVSSLRTTWRLWRLTNRPIVAVTVETVEAGNVGTALKIVVTNAGNRSAKNVRLNVDSVTLNSLLAAPQSDPPRIAVEKCFSPEAVIPMLTPGRAQEAAFGFLAGGSSRSTWKDQATLPLEVSYSDLETGTTFRYSLNIRIADNTSFTGSSWRRPAVRETAV